MNFETAPTILIIVLLSIPTLGQKCLYSGANLFFEKGYHINILKNNIIN